MMKPIVIKRNQHINKTAMFRALEVLFRYPDKEFSLTDIARIAGVKKANIGKIMGEFSKKDFVQITKLSNIWRIKANQGNGSFIKYKIIYNLSCIYQTDFIEKLEEYFEHPKTIILFGSFRKGEDISGSDIDIAIENDNLKEYKIFPFDMKLKGIEDRKIQLHLFNRKNIDLGLFNNIANGIVLSGFLEVKP